MPSQVRSRAVIFDFNGTLSDDEPLLLQVFSEIFAEHLGWHMPSEDYYRELAGRSDREIVQVAVAAHMGPVEEHSELVERLLDARGRRYLELVEEECPIRSHTEELVEGLVESGCRLAIVTGAQRDDVEFVLARSGIGQHFAVVVTDEDVVCGKPHPEGFLRAAEQLSLAPAEILVFEDSVAGVRAARAAGMRCVAVAGTRNPDVLVAEGVHVVDVLNRDLVALL